MAPQASPATSPGEHVAQGLLSSFLRSMFKRAWPGKRMDARRGVRMGGWARAVRPDGMLPPAIGLHG